MFVLIDQQSHISIKELIWNEMKEHSTKKMLSIKFHLISQLMLRGNHTAYVNSKMQPAFFLASWIKSWNYVNCYSVFQIRDLCQNSRVSVLEACYFYFYEGKKKQQKGDCKFWGKSITWII